MWRQAPGVWWLAPRREQIDGVRQLVLMQPLCGGADDARACWAEVAAAAERVMARRFAGVYCGGCDCLVYNFTIIVFNFANSFLHYSFFLLLN